MAKKKRSSMGKLAHETAEEVDQILADEEADLLLRTSINWDELRPQVNDKESYEKLIAAVEEATRKNESIAQLKKRIFDLGEGVKKVAKEVVDMIE